MGHGTERIEYRLIVGNTIKSLTRGTRGTTLQTHNTGVAVSIVEHPTQIFDDPGNAGYIDRDPATQIWLKTDGTTPGPTDITNRSNSSNNSGIPTR